MYAQLGKTVFENLKGFNEFSKSTAVTYAEHKPLTGKPLLQATGLNLDEITLSMRLHASFCNPANELNTLKGYMETFEVLPLLLGNGIKEGEFVLMSINNVVEDADAEGNIFSYIVNCTLKEYVTPHRLRAEQDANRRKALAVGDIKPVAKLKLNPPTPPQDIAKSVSAIYIHTNVINETVEQKGGPNSVTNRSKIAQSAESIKKVCADLRSKYEEVNNSISSIINNETIKEIRDTAEQIHEAASLVRNTLTLPGEFINSTKALTQSVSDLKVVARPIVLKSITGDSFETLKSVKLTNNT